MKRWIYVNCLLTAVVGVLVWLCVSLDGAPVRTAAERLSTPRAYAKAAITVKDVSGTISDAAGPEPVSVRSASAAKVRAFARRAVVPQQYAYLFQELPSIPLGVRQHIMELLYRRNSIRADVFHRLPGSSSAEQDAVVAQEIQGIDQQIALLCGTEGTRAIQLLALHGSMALIRTSVGPYMQFADVPIGTDQQVKLASVMKDSKIDYDNPEYKVLAQRPAEFAAAHAKVLREASTFLNTRQLEILTEHFHYLEGLPRADGVQGGP